MVNERDAKALQASVDTLMEYFDSVQIFVSKNKSDDQTIGHALGKGSLFARVGQISLWLSKVESMLMGEGDDDGEEGEEGGEEFHENA